MKKTYCCLFSPSSSRRRGERWDILRERERTTHALSNECLSSLPLSLGAKIKESERWKHISFKWRTSRYEQTSCSNTYTIDITWCPLKLTADGEEGKRITVSIVERKCRSRHRQREKVQCHNCAGVMRESEFIGRRLRERRAIHQFCQVQGLAAIKRVLTNSDQFVTFFFGVCWPTSAAIGNRNHRALPIMQIDLGSQRGSRHSRCKRWPTGKSRS